ncbi:YaaC family protein [Virgibacillus kekensis]|uniref:YaaC family protein n=1 Tax=Virgibacillus kekensis TaxID=202261 RepID=A0ABV9DI35_9BACI
MAKSSTDTVYTYLQSQQTCQDFLYKCYQHLDGVDAATKSYENCNAFMYNMMHGRQFYANGKKLNTLLKPILFFYGMVHLLKANLLTIRPDYPESTTILAHGVSTRKRKKKDYTFMGDEVKVQHNGLFPYFSEHLFKQLRVPFEKIKMDLLFGLIPEMDSLFTMQGERRMVPVGDIGGATLRFPDSLLDHYHLTVNTFIERIRPFLPTIKNIEQTNSAAVIKLDSPLTANSGPFYVHSQDKTLYFPAAREQFIPVSEVMVHYLLLFNLSMLCRYEPEWWGDLLSSKSEADYPFIVHFLEVTAEKIPHLLGEELLNHVNFLH